MILLLYITAILNVSLGLFTYLSNRKDKLNIRFFILTIFIALWAATNAEFQNSPDAATMNIWAALSYQSAGALLTTLVYFSRAQVKKAGSWKLLNNLPLFVLVFILIGSILPGFFTTGVNFDAKSIIPSAAYPLLLLSYLFLAVRSTFNLIIAIRRAKKVNKSTQRLISYGSIGALIAGVITNLVLPASGVYVAVTLGPSFTLILFTAVVYGILKYQLFNVRLLLGRIVYFGLLTFVTYIIFFTVVIAYQLIFGSPLSAEAFLVGPIVGMIFVLAYNQVEGYIRREINSRYINPGYDPFEVVDNLSKSLSLLIKKEDITETTSQSISRALRLDKSNVEIYDNKEALGIQELKIYNALKELWNVAKSEPVFQEVQEYRPSDNLVKTADSVEYLRDYIKRASFKAIIPLGVADDLVGYIALGDKDGKSPYNYQDVDLIRNISYIVSQAINRALLYEEVQQFNASLQRKIKLATKELLDQNELLETALTRLEAIRQQEQDMLDVMGHELRTPITIIRNALGFLKLKTDAKREVTQEQIASYSEKGLEAARREIILIETLLAATKMEAKRVQLNLDAVNIIDVIGIAMEAHQQIADERGIKVIFHKPKGDAADWQVYADRTRIQEIQDNLVSNAIKYTMKGTVEISVEKLKTKLKINVKDSGIGITKEDLAKLGRKFFRAKQYIKDGASGAVVRPGGTGLGLYVSFELVKLMGGNVTIESELGKGSIFSYTMPTYHGQEPKHIDQTFEKSQEDQTLDELTAKEGSRKTREIVKQILDRKDLEVEEKKEESEDIKGFRTISSTGDIISKISPKKVKK